MNHPSTWFLPRVMWFHPFNLFPRPEKQRGPAKKTLSMKGVCSSPGLCLPIWGLWSKQLLNGLLVVLGGHGARPSFLQRRGAPMFVHVLLGKHTTMFRAGIDWLGLASNQADGSKTREPRRQSP